MLTLSVQPTFLRGARGLTAKADDEPRLNALRRLRACATGKLRTQSRVKERKGAQPREWQMYRTLAGIAAAWLIVLAFPSPTIADYLEEDYLSALPAEIDETVIVRRPPVVRETVVVRPVVRERVVIRPVPVVRERVVIRPVPVVREALHHYAYRPWHHRRHHHHW